MCIRDRLSAVSQSQDLSNLSTGWFSLSAAGSELRGGGKTLVPSENVNVEYYLDETIVARSQLNGALTSTETVMNLDNGDNVVVDDYLLIDDEFVKVTIDEATKLTIERAQKNTTAASHQDNDLVYKIGNLAYSGDTYGYLVFNGPNNIKFFAPVGKEGNVTSFAISNQCLNGTYTLDAILINGARKKGHGKLSSLALSSSTYTPQGYSNTDTWTSVLADYAFKVSNAIDYVQPTLVGADATSGAFTITGDKGSALTTGGTISYTVASNAITAGSFETEYVTMTFDITSSSTGQVTGSRTILLNKSGSDYTFSASINTLSTSDSNLKNTWKTGSKYQLSSISISNGVSEVNYKPNGTYNDTYSNLSGNHDVYYLDQFSFTVSDQ